MGAFLQVESNELAGTQALKSLLVEAENLGLTVPVTPVKVCDEVIPLSPHLIYQTSASLVGSLSEYSNVIWNSRI